MKENARCAEQVEIGFYTDNLHQAQLRCLNTSNCSMVMGHMGKHFEHHRFDLCGSEDSTIKKQDYTPNDRRDGYIPDGLYIKPGISYYLVIIIQINTCHSKF